MGLGKVVPCTHMKCKPHLRYCFMLIVIIKGQRKKWNSNILSLKALQRLWLRVLFVQAEKSLAYCRAPHPVSKSTGPQPSHYTAVTAHLNTLIPHGLLGSMLPQCTGDRHLSMSPVSRAQISWQWQEKFNNQFSTKHSETELQRHWPVAGTFW